MNDRTNNEAGSIVIGEGVTVSGKFIVPGRAVINGSMDGELQADELLVGAQGKIVGNVKVRKADVFGEMHDTLLALMVPLVRPSMCNMPSETISPVSEKPSLITVGLWVSRTATPVLPRLLFKDSSLTVIMVEVLSVAVASGGSVFIFLDIVSGIDDFFRINRIATHGDFKVQMFAR